MRILIVDDNEFVRLGVIKILTSDAGITICGEAKDGDEGVAKARELQPDMILLDISMPGRNGFEIAKQLRQEFRQTKILMMSQHDPSFILPQALAVGANGCVDKGLLTATLLPAIAALEKEKHGETP